MDKLKDITEKYLLNRTVFKLLIIVAMMITAVPYLHGMVGGYVKILLAYGYLVLAYEVLTKKFFSIFRDKINFALVAFGGSYLVTVILNRDLNFGSNVKALAYMAIIFALLFMTRPDKSKESLTKEIELVTAVVIACTYILSLATFITYIFSIDGSYTVGDVTHYYGWYENRLWGVYNANTGSTLNAISILLSVGFILAHKEQKTCVILNSLNIVLQFVCLIMTGSRAALYALYVLLAVLAFVYGIKLCADKLNKNSIKGVLCGAVASVLTIVVLMGCVPVLKTGISYLPSITTNIAARMSPDEENESKDIPPIAPVDVTRMEEVENREGGFFTGRVDIWKACLGAFKESPAFGVTRENLYDRASTYLPGNSWKESLEIGGSHNIYVCILVSSGFVGFILMLIFAAYTFIKSGIAILKNFKNLNPWLLITFLLVAMFYVTEFVESRILYQMGIFNVLFWTYCGYMYALAKRTSDQEKQVK